MGIRFWQNLSIKKYSRNVEKSTLLYLLIKMKIQTVILSMFFAAYTYGSDITCKSSDGELVCPVVCVNPPEWCYQCCKVTRAAYFHSYIKDSHTTPAHGGVIIWRMEDHGAPKKVSIRPLISKVLATTEFFSISQQNPCEFPKGTSSDLAHVRLLLPHPLPVLLLCFGCLQAWPSILFYEV